MKHDLDDALNDAVRTQFIHLFSVLVKETSDRKQALERFKAGLTNLAEAEDAVSKIICKGE